MKSNMATIQKNSDTPDLKGHFTPKSKLHIFPLTCSAIHSSKLFWCELPSVGDIGHKDVCLLSCIMEPDGIRLVVLKAPKKHINKYSTAMCLYGNHDLVTQDK